jgi:hypothetical protein
MKEKWVVSIRDRCQAAGIPFFFKQWGGVRKSKAGRSLDGRTYDERPSQSTRPIASKTERAAWIERVEQTVAQSAW